MTIDELKKIERYLRGLFGSETLAVVGYDKLATALTARATDLDIIRSDTGASLIDAAQEAVRARVQTDAYRSRNR